MERGATKVDDLHAMWTRIKIPENNAIGIAWVRSEILSKLCLWLILCLCNQSVFVCTPPHSSV